MDVFDAVRTLLAVRSYQPTPVPETVIQRIVEAGRLTGSAEHAQPFRTQCGDYIPQLWPG